MGTDPASSVVDPENRVWGMPNVLVTDGACWPTAGWQNPTLTIMAVTHRACSLAAESLGRTSSRTSSQTSSRTGGRASGLAVPERPGS